MKYGKYICHARKDGELLEFFTCDDLDAIFLWGKGKLKEGFILDIQEIHTMKKVNGKWVEG